MPIFQNNRKKDIIKMTTIRKLHDHPYANCKVIETEGTVNETNGGIRTFVLRSYTTDVVLVRETSTTWELTCYGTYSQTTRRQIGWFFKDIGSPFTYFDAKKSFAKSVDIIVNK